MVGEIPSPQSPKKAREMETKHTYGVWGAVVGALSATALGFFWGGWTTSSGTTKMVDAAVSSAMIPVCAQAMLANPASVAALKLKKPSDYDDAVRDNWKPVGFKVPTDYQFRRDCGKAIEQLMTAAASKT